MCMHINTDYSAIFELIWFSFGTLMDLYVSHIVLKFQMNISNSSWIIAIYVFLP